MPPEQASFVDLSLFVEIGTNAKWNNSLVPGKMNQLCGPPIQFYDPHQVATLEQRNVCPFSLGRV